MTILTRDELAQELRISIDLLEKLIHDEARPIPHLRAGRRYLFCLEDVIQHLTEVSPAGSVAMECRDGDASSDVGRA